MPGWLAGVIVVVPITIIVLAVFTGARYRARAHQVKRADAHRGTAASAGVGSEAAIDDPSGYSWEAMLEGLALEPEDDGPTPEGQSFDDTYFATMLGLQASLVSSGGEEGVLRPNVLWGSRPLGQVFIRSGPDERAEGLQVVTGRHWRHITVLRVD